MQIVIAGAGSVGRSIARELISHGHEVTLVDRSTEAMRIASVPQADWQLADACDIDALERAGAETCDVIVAATGDDKANLVISLLAKTEYGVPRTVARVNNPKSEWLFDETWGVDVAVSTPRFMTAPVDSPEAAAGAEAAETALPAAEPAAAGECPDWADGAEAEAPGALESWSKTAGRLDPAPASVSQRASSSRA